MAYRRGPLPVMKACNRRRVSGVCNGLPLASVVALESLRATRSIGKDAACCSKVVDTKLPNKGQPPNSGQMVVYQLVRYWEVPLYYTTYGVEFTDSLCGFRNAEKLEKSRILVIHICCSIHFATNFYTFRIDYFLLYILLATKIKFCTGYLIAEKGKSHHYKT